MPLRQPIVATATAAVGQLIWFLLVRGDTCSSLDGPVLIPYALIALGALAEMCAAAARGRPWGIWLIWGLLSALVLFGSAVVFILLAAGAGGCFD
mgnify:CR=1 FL=1